MTSTRREVDSTLGRVMDRCYGVAAVLFAALLSACADSSDNPPVGNGGAVEERFVELARTLEAERIALGVPGAAIAVVEHGEVTFARGFGSKSPSGGGDVQPSTLFRIGSCTKMLTAISVLQTVADGRVDLDRPVTDYVPEFHFTRAGMTVDGVTVRHLLTHSSGIVDALAIPIEPAAAEERSDAALGQYLAGPFADAGYLMVPPGTFYNYSNPNYALLGRLSELVTQQPYRTLLKQQVLSPLGMDRTFATAEDVLRDGDYALGKGCDSLDVDCAVSIVKPESFDQTWISPAGGVWSSVLDLSKIAEFLVHGDELVLPTEQWQTMTSAQVSTLEVGDLTGYGYGVSVTKGVFLGASEFYGVELLGHSGGLPGYAANIMCARSLDSCVITLASDGGGQFPNSIATAFETLFELPASSSPPDLTVHQERYSSYIGTYRDAFDVGEVTISTNAGKLYVSIPKFDAEETPYDSELAPLAGDSFVLTAAGMSIPITFIADATGEYKYIRSRTSVPIRSDPAAD